MTNESVVAQPTAANSLRYAWYVALVLMLFNTMAFIDRQILGLLVMPIKTELGISDTGMGLLQGLAFGLFFTFLGLPMGRIADRSNRRNLVVVELFSERAIGSRTQHFRWASFSARDWR